MKSNKHNPFIISINGKSHDPFISTIAWNMPVGFEPNWDFVNQCMERRRPGSSTNVTSRVEEDKPVIQSGIKDGKIVDKKVKFVINNNNVVKQNNSYLRPGHADWTSLIKYKKVFSGGGMFSGRLTAPIVYIGSIIRDYLKQKHNIEITSVITNFCNITNPTKDQIEHAIANLIKRKDSCGGILRITGNNIPQGIGSPFIDNCESTISKYLFAIPGVKGVSFGDGFWLSLTKGSQTNDSLKIENGKIVSTTNHMGGILGGITNGMPLIVNVGFKPTPSIGKKQSTVDFKQNKNTQISINGRNDPSIIIRGQVVAESYFAIALYELILNND